MCILWANKMLKKNNNNAPFYTIKNVFHALNETKLSCSCECWHETGIIMHSCTQCRVGGAGVGSSSPGGWQVVAGSGAWVWSQLKRGRGRQRTQGPPRGGGGTLPVWTYMTNGNRLQLNSNCNLGWLPFTRWPIFWKNIYFI